MVRTFHQLWLPNNCFSVLYKCKFYSYFCISMKNVLLLKISIALQRKVSLIWSPYFSANFNLTFIFETIHLCWSSSDLPWNKGKRGNGYFLDLHNYVLLCIHWSKLGSIRLKLTGMHPHMVKNVSTPFTQEKITLWPSFKTLSLHTNSHAFSISFQNLVIHQNHIPN